MSDYRDEELLAGPIDKTLHGIREIERAIDARIANVDGFTLTHRLELVALAKKLLDLKAALAQLRSETR